MRYFLAIILPPVAVALSAGPVSFLLNCLLTLAGWIPGVIHALVVVNRHNSERHHKQSMRELRKIRRSLAALAGALFIGAACAQDAPETPPELTKGASITMTGQSFGGKSIETNWKLPWGSYDKDFTSERGILLSLSTTSPKAKEKPFWVKVEWAWVARDGSDKIITKGGEEILSVRSGQIVKFFTPPGVFTENRVRLVALNLAWAEGVKYVGWMARVIDGDGNIIAGAQSMDYLKSMIHSEWPEAEGLE